ncbi:Monoamine oxidase [Legionella beliardensis]|uniref:Monoamine oxidase n=2 Tax=Legionella beliardensis TaxID=91822 RepID=A0A378I2Y5_9GAMM|nr:Monoamine oxidase [Legionella beliardensis]
MTSIETNETGELKIKGINLKEQQDFSFNYIVMAVSLTSLQATNPSAIKFKPELSSLKKQAINSVSFNQNVARVYFEVNHRFWLKDSKTAMTIIDIDTSWIEDHSACCQQKRLF